MNKNQPDECEGCFMCDPSATVGVDYMFLVWFDRMYEKLLKLDPDSVAVGWKDECKRYMKMGFEQYAKNNTTK